MSPDISKFPLRSKIIPVENHCSKPVNCTHAQGGMDMITCSKHCFDINLCIYVYLRIYPSTRHSTKCSLAPVHDYLHICWLKKHLGFIISSLSSGEIIALLHNPRYTYPAIYAKHMIILKVKNFNFLIYIVCEFILNIYTRMCL